MSLIAGMRLGPYRILTPVGAGGMGEVYRARDERLQRDVAIKVLPASLATDPHRMARFGREAQALASVSHPNIAAIYGVEESDGAKALVMEFVDGATLAERIAAGPLPAEEAIAIARQIAEGLEAAHEKGLVHRDLKPANVKITPDGQVKVLDFGLAKAMNTDAVTANPADSPTVTAQATRAGQIMGTAAYMAPEQARGKAVDRRADIWAFGVVLVEMLTGRSMFAGETVSDTLAAVLRGEIDLAQLPAGTAPAVRRLIARCLERDPKRRLRDIGDAWIEFDTPAPASSAVLPVHRWWPWAAVAIGVAGLGWGLLPHAGAPDARGPTRFSLDTNGIFLGISPDGSEIAWSEGLPAERRLVLRRMDQFDAKPLSGGEGGSYPVFSPDGRWVAFSNGDGRIKKLPVTGGTAVPLCDGSTSSGAAWLDDDTIVFAEPKGLRRVSSGGGTPEELTTVNAANGEVWHTHPQALPGGRLLFTVSKSIGFNPSYAAVLDLKKKTYRTLVRTGLVTGYTPSGHLVYVRSGTLFAMPFDIERLIATGPEVAVAENISMAGPTGYADYSFSRTGLLAYIMGGAAELGTTLGWADREGSTETFAPTPQLWGTGRLSPDGSRVANGMTTPGSGRDIWVYDIGRRTSIRLSFDGPCDYPIWSPDGRRIVFGCNREKGEGLYSVPSDGSGKPELLLKTERGPVPTSFTPDGKTLVFMEIMPDRKTRVFLLPLGGQPRPLHETSYSEGAGEVSPDGRWLAYSSNESGASEVYVQPFPGPGAKIRISLQGGTAPRWSRNGRELFYRDVPGPAQRAWAVDVQTGAQGFQAGTPRPLFTMAAGTTWGPAPDGKHFLVEMAPFHTQRGDRMNFITDWFEELRRRAPANR